jgi:hypothetical protein
MKNYLSQNSKMKNSSRPIYNFGIPAYRSASGFVTCPMAGQCAVGCYAKQGAYTWPVVRNAYEARLALTKDSERFIDTISDELVRRNISFVRIHDSGDFYSPKYMSSWFRIARRNPSVQFYAYTKMVAMFQREINLGNVPANLSVIFSEGGKQDSLIKSNDRHSRVFSSLDELKNAGYTDTTKDDSKAFLGSNLIGLVYHGSKGKQWTTNKGESRV